MGRAGDHVARIARLRRRHRAGHRGVRAGARDRRGMAPRPDLEARRVPRRSGPDRPQTAGRCAATHVVPRGELNMADAWIIDVVRTPRGKGRPDGALHDVQPQELLAQCLRALAARVGFEPVEVDDVIAGNGILTGDHDAVGRLATLLAGWPATVPGMTLNRFCGSAQQAITVAAMGVASGHQDLVVGGGIESMSRWNLAAGQGP